MATRAKPSNWTPLTKALWFRRTEEISKFLPATTLLDAAGVGDLDFLRNAISNGADVNCQDDDSGFHALHFALMYGQVEVARYLLSLGAIPSNNKSSVACAAEFGVEEIALELIDKGITTKEAADAAWYSLERDSITVLRRLLAQFSPIEEQIIQWIGRAAAMGATKCLDFLAKNGAPLTKRYEYGSSLLHLAMEFSGNAETIRRLLQLGADPHQVDDSGWDALQWAVEWASDEHADDDDREIVDLIRAAMK